jgi:hypothetical protein
MKVLFKKTQLHVCSIVNLIIFVKSVVAECKDAKRYKQGRRTYEVAYSVVPHKIVYIIADVYGCII